MQAKGGAGISRREFLRKAGLAAAGAGGVLLLRGDKRPSKEPGKLPAAKPGRPSVDKGRQGLADFFKLCAGDFKEPGVYVHPPDYTLFLKTADERLATPKQIKEATIFAKAVHATMLDAKKLIADTHPELHKDYFAKNEINVFLMPPRFISQFVSKVGASGASGTVYKPSATAHFDALTSVELHLSEPGRHRIHVMLDAGSIKTHDLGRIYPLMIHEFAGNVPYMKDRIDRSMSLSPSGRRKLTLESEVQAHREGIEAMRKVLGHEQLKQHPNYGRFRRLLTRSIEEDTGYCRAWEDQLKDFEAKELSKERPK